MRSTECPVHSAQRAFVGTALSRFQIVPSAQCSGRIVQCPVGSVHAHPLYSIASGGSPGIVRFFAVCIAQWGVASVQCTVLGAQCIVLSEDLAVCIAPWAVASVQCSVRSAQCPVRSAQ